MGERHKPLMHICLCVCTFVDLNYFLEYYFALYIVNSSLHCLFHVFRHCFKTKAILTFCFLPANVNLYASNICHQTIGAYSNSFKICSIKKKSKRAFSFHELQINVLFFCISQQMLNALWL